MVLFSFLIFISMTCLVVFDIHCIDQIVRTLTAAHLTAVPVLPDFRLCDCKQAHTGAP